MACTTRCSCVAWASVAERTAGMLAAYRLNQPLSAADERAAFEATVAAEVAADDRS